MKNIAILGPLNVDIIAHGEAPLEKAELLEWAGTSDVDVLTAGAIGYFTRIISKLGHDAKVISAIGDDPLSNFILNDLDSIGVDTSGVVIQENTYTALAIYFLLLGSKKRPLTYRMPTHDLWPLEFTSGHLDLVKGADWFHHGGYLHFKPAWDGSVLDIFKHAKENGVPTSLDPQFPLFDYPRPWITPLKDILPHVDYLFVDKNEACNLVDKENYEIAANELLELGPRAVIVKLGKDGSILLDKDCMIRQEARKIESIVDSIGAGDSFDAGFIDAFLKGKSKEACLEYATEIASRTLNYPGGQF